MLTVEQKLGRQIDELIKQNAALAAENDHLRAKLAAMESQDPDCWRITHRSFCGIVTDKKEIAEDPFYSGCVFPLYAKPVPSHSQQGAQFNQQELDIIRQWHNCVEDCNPKFLQADGFDDNSVYQKVLAMLGRRPNHENASQDTPKA